MPSRLYDRPIGAALAGALAIAFSGILFRAAHVSPSTGAFYRCACALPVLWPLSWLEDRRYGAAAAQAARPRLAGGVFFAVDLVAWHEGIEQVGAGLATVLGNLQVVFVGLLAWLILRRAAVEPLAGRDPGRAVRRAADLGRVRERRLRQEPGARRRVRDPDRARLLGLPARAARRATATSRRPAGPLFDATLVSALGCIPIGLAIGDLDWTPGWPAWGYLLLLALSSQALGWLLISITLPRLPAALTSVLLTFQPVLTVLFAWAILDESPSALQLGGVALVLCRPADRHLGQPRKACRPPSRGTCRRDLGSRSARSSLRMDRRAFIAGAATLVAAPRALAGLARRHGGRARHGRRGGAARRGRPRERPGAPLRPHACEAAQHRDRRPDGRGRTLGARCRLARPRGHAAGRARAARLRRAAVHGRPSRWPSRLRERREARRGGGARRDSRSRSSRGCAWARSRGTSRSTRAAARSGSLSGRRREQVAVVDVSRRARPRLVRSFEPPFLAHDVGWAPGGNRVWVSSGDRNELALYAARSGRLLQRLAADRPPQHFTFRGRARLRRERRERHAARSPRRRAAAPQDGHPGRLVQRAAGAWLGGHARPRHGHALRPRPHGRVRWHADGRALLARRVHRHAFVTIERPRAARRLTGWRRPQPSSRAPTAATRPAAGSASARGCGEFGTLVEEASGRRAGAGAASRRSASSTSRPRRPSGSRPACRSSTACSAAGSSRRRSCSSAASPESASRRCC